MWRVALLTVVLALLGTSPASAGWQPLDGNVNDDLNVNDAPAVGAALSGYGDLPYVAWHNSTPSYSSEAKRFSSGQWNSLPSFMHANGVAEDPPDLIADADGVYVAWSESTPGQNVEIRVARLNGGTWQDLGGSVSDPSANNAFSPSLARCGSTICVAYSQRTFDATNGDRDEVFVKSFNGTTWTPMGGALNFDPEGYATKPVLVSAGGGVGVAWVESDQVNEAGRIHAAVRNGTSWQPLGAGPNPVMRAPDGLTTEVGATFVGTVPYLAWVESTPTPEEDDPPTATESTVRVSRFDASAGVWTPAANGAPVDSGQGRAGDVDVASVGGAAHVAYTENNAAGDSSDLRVKRVSASGKSWQELRGTAPIDRSTRRQTFPDLEDIGGVPHLAWTEDMGADGADLFVSRFVVGLTNSRRPAMSGTPSPGSELTCDPGDWSPTATFQFLWERGPAGTTDDDDPSWSAIDGASGPQYSVQQADVGSRLRCRVIATADPDIAEAVSTSLRADVGPPVNTRPPHLSGAPLVGETLTCEPGEWATGADFTFQWLSDGYPIPGATGPTHVLRASVYEGGTLVRGDGGTEISCRVTATNDVGASQADSDNSVLAVDGPPVNQTPPTVVVGSPQPNLVNVEARCEPGTWTDDYSASGRDGHAYEFQWLRNGEIIPGAIERTYSFAIEDLGGDVLCRVSASNPAGRSAARDSDAFFVPLPAVTSKGRLISAQGKNQFVPTNLLALGKEYDEAVKQYSREQLLRAKANDESRCRAAGQYGPQLTKPTDAELVPPFGPALRCRILWHFEREINVREDGAFLAKFFGTQYRELDMGFGIAPVDPSRSLPIDPALEARLKDVTPVQVIWDVDDDGRTDATCPGSAPVLRSLLGRGDWNPRAIVVYPNSVETGLFSEARFGNGIVMHNPQGITNLPRGVLRNGQPFACRTSVEQPPEPKSGPCVTEGRMGKVRVTGNLCPINVRAMDQNEIFYLKTNDPELYELLEEMAIQENKDDATTRAAPRRAIALPDAASELLPRQFLGGTTVSDVGATLQNTASSMAGFKPSGQLPPELTPPPIPASVTKNVPKLDVEKAQFAMDQMYVARGPLMVNGIKFTPQVPNPSLLVPSDAQNALQTIKSMKLAIPDAKKTLGNLVLEAKGRLRQEVDDKVNQGKAELLKASLDEIKDATKNLKFGPFKWGGDMDIKLENDGTATMTATASIPFLKGTPGGGGLTTRAKLRGDINGNITLEGFKLKADSAYLAAMKIKDLDFRYDNGIQVQGKIVFPFPPANPAIVIHNFELGPEGQFRALHLEFQAGAGTGIAVGPGVFLTSVDAGYDDGEKKFEGGAGLSVGPSPGGGCPTLGIDAHFAVVFKEVVTFDARGNLQLVCIRLFDVEVHADTTGYISVKGGFNLEAGPVFFNSIFAGSLLLPKWQIEYKGSGGIRGIPLIGTLEAQMQAVLGDRGLAVCGSIKVFLIGRVGAGAGVRFVNGRPPLTPDELISNLRVFTGCDLSSWKSLPARVRAAQAGGGQSFTMPAGSRGVALSFQGAGDAPRIRLRSPSGKAYDLSDAVGGKEVDGLFASIVDDEDRTVVLIGKPEAGQWSLETVDGSPRVARIERADILPPAKVTGKVGGIGSSRVLRYAVPRIDGQVVHLFEEANGAMKLLRTIRGGGKGTVRFQTSEANGTRRRIVAKVVQDELPRANVTVATFNAPSPKVGRPRAVRVRRRGTRLVVSWRRAPLALTYDVRVSVSDGQRLLLTPEGRRTKVVVPRVGRRKGAVVRVLGISRAGRRGPVATKRLRAARRRGAQRRRGRPG